MWRKWLHDGVMPNTAFAPRTVDVGCSRTSVREPGACRRAGTRNQFPERSGGARRPLRQQRLAAGAAEADHQADVGQRRHREPGDRRTAAGHQRGVVSGRRTRPDHQRPRRAPVPRPLVRGAVFARRRASRRLPHGASWLRPHARRTPRQRRRLQRLRDSNRATRRGSTAAWRSSRPATSFRSPARRTTT